MKPTHKVYTIVYGYCEHGCAGELVGYNGQPATEKRVVKYVLCSLHQLLVLNDVSAMKDLLGWMEKVAR